MSGITIGATSKSWLDGPWPVRLSWVVVALGAALQIATLLGARALWNDEAMVSVNIHYLGFADFNHRMDYDQVAPYGWLAVQKLFDGLTGRPEFDLRLVAVFCGLPALLLFRSLAFALLDRFGALMAVTLYAFSPIVVRFSTEVKPYIIDLLVVVAALWLGLALLKSPARRACWIGLLLLGCVAPFFTFAGLFGLAAVGGVLFLVAAIARDYRRALAIAAMGVLWAAVFVVVYLTLSLPQTQGTSLTSGGSAHFFARKIYAPMPPTSLADVMWYLTWTKDQYYYFFRERALVPFLLTVVGMILASRRLGWRAVMLLAPGLFAILASGAHVYPAFARLMIFFLPAVLICMGMAAGWIARLRPRLTAPLAAAMVAVAMAPTAVDLYQAMTDRPAFAFQEIRPAMATIQHQARPGDVVYVAGLGAPAYLYYRPRYGLGRTPWIVGDGWARWACFPRDLPQDAAPSRMWVLIANYRTEPEPFGPLAANLAKRGVAGEPILRAKATNVWLYELPLRRIGPDLGRASVADDVENPCEKERDERVLNGARTTRATGVWPLNTPAGLSAAR